MSHIIFPRLNNTLEKEGNKNISKYEIERKCIKFCHILQFMLTLIIIDIQVRKALIRM